MGVIRVRGSMALVILAVVVIFLVAAALLALKIILWLLPVIIIGMAAWVLIYIFNRPPRQKLHAVNAEFKVKD